MLGVLVARASNIDSAAVEDVLDVISGRCVNSLFGNMMILGPCE